MKVYAENAANSISSSYARSIFPALMIVITAFLLINYSFEFIAYNSMPMTAESMLEFNN
jgi:hypothetical protein